MTNATAERIDELVLKTHISYVASIYSSVEKAKAAYEKLYEAQGDEVVIIDAAYVEKTENSRLKIHDHTNWAYGEDIIGGSAGGVVIGGLIGIIGGAILLPAAIGALVGGVLVSIYGRRDKFSHQDLIEIADMLPIGTSALIAIVDDESLLTVETQFKKLGGDKLHSNKIPRGTVASLLIHE